MHILTLEGTLLSPPSFLHLLRLCSDVPAGHVGETRFSIMPTDGSLYYRTLVITCDSRELPAVMGKTRVYIERD